MIIFGTRGITYRKDGGRFFCPECDGEQPYDRKRVRRFFTLYFIPLIPLNLLAEYIECPRCGGTYRDPKVLVSSGYQNWPVTDDWQNCVERYGELPVW